MCRVQTACAPENPGGRKWHQRRRGDEERAPQARGIGKIHRLALLSGRDRLAVGGNRDAAFSRYPRRRCGIHGRHRSISAVLFVLGAGQIWVGVGLRRLRKWARIPTGILSGLGLLGFPLGTIINAYILYLVFCQKGKTVFSEEYQIVVEQTPHLKYRTSIIVWILLALVLAFIALALIMGFVVSRRL